MPLNAAKELRKARKLASSGKLNDASKVCNSLLNHYPGNKHAKELLREIGDTTTSNSVTALRSAVAHGDYRKAIQEGLRLHETQPEDSETSRLLSAAYSNIGDFRSSLRFAESAARNEPNNLEAQTNLGFVQSQLGMHDAALESFQLAYGIDENSEATIRNLVLGLHKTGSYQAAVSILETASSRHPDRPNILNLLGETFSTMGDWESALAAFKSSERLTQDNDQVRFSIATCLMNLGRQIDAASEFESILLRHPNLVECHINLASLYLGLNEHDRAKEYAESALRLDPNNKLALNNKGLSALKLGDLHTAIQHFEAAIGKDPDFINACVNHAQAQRLLGEVKKALPGLIRALGIDPRNSSALGLLAEILTSLDLEEIGYSVQLESCFSLLLQPPCVVRPIDLTAGAARWLKKHPALDHLFYGRVENPEETAKALSEITLLECLLRLAPICDLQFEEVLRAIRYKFLVNTVEGSVFDVKDSFCTALAIQCFINEFVYGETKEETELVEKLAHKLKSELTSNFPIKSSALSCLGCYRDLFQYHWLHNLDEGQEPEALLKLTIQNSIQEARIKTSVPKLSQINNETSLRVRDQYEQNPYPRWTQTQTEIEPLSITQLAQRLDLDFAAREDHSQISILVAGCGTGQQAIQTALRFRNAIILAIDLSLNSLAYAIRKSKELQINNVEYAQADILDLNHLGRKFDVIECVGVLHHMENPREGWSQLQNLLKTDGLMKIGLYSKKARRNLSAVKSRIDSPLPESTSAMLGKRRDLIESMAKDSKLKSALCEWTDFYSTSEFRDLLFHSQEAHFSLLEIKELLSHTNMNFMGFEFPNESTYTRFKTDYPDKRSEYDLDLWDEFEKKHPRTFGGMYQFWVNNNNPA